MVVAGLTFLVKVITDNGSADLPDSGVLKAPTVADASGGILINQDGTLGGTPPAGSVRLDVYLDLMCPICHEFETINGADVKTLRESGTVAVYYHPVSILDRASRGTHYSTRAAAALATVAEYDPTHFEAFFGVLFDNQPAENSAGLSNAQIANFASSAGVPSGVVSKFADGEFTRWVTAATDTASVDGLKGTPWIRAEQQVDINSNTWAQPGAFAQTFQYIHDLGLQSYLDAVAAAQAAAATPSPTASTATTATP